MNEDRNRNGGNGIKTVLFFVIAVIIAYVLLGNNGIGLPVPVLTLAPAQNLQQNQKAAPNPNDFVITEGNTTILSTSTPVQYQKPVEQVEVVPVQTVPVVVVTPPNNQTDVVDNQYDQLLACLSVAEQAKYLVSKECLVVIQTEKMRCAGVGANQNICDRVNKLD